MTTIRLYLLLLILLLSGCRTHRQIVQEGRTAEIITSRDSVAHVAQGRKTLTVKWWGEQPPIALPESVAPPHLTAQCESLKSGGYSVELTSDEQSERVGRDTQTQSSSTSYLAQEKSGRNSNVFFLWLALGLCVTVLIFIFRVRLK